jgi:hypothetical protein
MATLTASGTTFTSYVTYSSSVFVVRIPTQGRGTRTLSLSLDHFDTALTSDEQGLVYSIQDFGVAGREFRCELSREDLATLARIKTKLDAALGGIVATVPVTISSPTPKTFVPSPKQATFVAPPVDAANGKVVEVKTNGSETARVNTATLNQIASTMELRTVGYGIDATERRINQLQKTVSKLSGQLQLLFYDIPAVLNDDCPNPSPVFWRYGFRLNDSVWIMTKESVNAPAVQGYLAHWGNFPAVSAHVIPQSEEQTDKLRKIGVEKLREEVVRTHGSLIKRLASASERYVESMAKLDESEREGVEVSPLEREAPEKYRDNTVRGILRGVGEDLNDAVRCAELFDATEEIKDLFNALRGVLRSEVGTFNAQMRQKGKKLAPMPK